MMYFIDTSALFKRYVQEPGSDVVESLFVRSAPCHISAVTTLELLSNLQRLRTVDRALSDLDFSEAWNAFFLDVADRLVEVAGATAGRVSAASEMLITRYLTPIDALQIATARSLGPETVFVSSDRKLNELVRDQGMRVLDPCHPEA
ncbi:MAG: type II toxin-antitoxin system VapC family toxin [Bacillota bacterium]|nr:type II toxin-antitoxin system VapC family toxin [Bacillota bacterium]